MRKTKVAFFSDILIEGFDGAQRTMFHIINRIPRDKYEFVFVCGEGPGNNFDFQVLDIPRITVPFNNNYSMAMPALAYFKMKKALDNFRPDVIHIASPSLLGRFALEYANPRAIPVIAIYHTHYISYVEYYLKNIPLVTEVAKSSVISGQRNFYNQCSLVLVPTESIIKELADFGFESSKMKIWRRGIDPKIFNPQKKDKNFLKKITGNSRYNILFASRLVWEKNLETLISIYKYFEKQGSDVNFIVAGDGPAKTEMQIRMPNAFFLGKIDQQKLAVLYASSDVFIFPSISETFGNVVTEAMASGCPCIIAQGGGTQSFIRDGINGILCDPNKESDYYNKVQLLRENETLCNNMIQEGLKFTNKLNWERLVHTYLGHVDACASKITFA